MKYDLAQCSIQFVTLRAINAPRASTALMADGAQSIKSMLNM